MTMKLFKPPLVIALLALCSLCPLWFTSETLDAQSSTYYPPAGAWAKKSPAELGMDPIKLKEAVDFALTRESNREMDFSDQERIFGSLLVTSRSC